MKTIIQTSNDFYRSLTAKDKAELGEKIVDWLCSHDDLTPEQAVEKAIASMIFDMSEEGEDIGDYAIETAKQVMAGYYADVQEIADELVGLRDEYKRETD